MTGEFNAAPRRVSLRSSPGQPVLGSVFFYQTRGARANRYDRYITIAGEPREALFAVSQVEGKWCGGKRRWQTGMSARENSSPETRVRAWRARRENAPWWVCMQ
jgi:hypothetical protein